MAETTYFPRRLILAGAIVSGVLLALAVHMLGARYGLDLGGLWRSDTNQFMPAGAAIAWWLIATVGFSGGYFTANLMHSAASGQIPQRMRQFLIAVGVLILAGAGQAASAPSPVPIGRARRPCSFMPRRRDGVLRRAFRVAQSLRKQGLRETKACRSKPAGTRRRPAPVLSTASLPLRLQDAAG
jgi:hypothetical protein